MSRKDVNELLDELEAVKGEYDALFASTSQLYDDINDTHTEAYAVVEKTAALIASIKHAPVSVTTKAKKVLTEKQKVCGKNELKKQQRNKDIADGAAAVAALGIGGILATSFKDFFCNIAKKLGKYGGWILAVVLIIFVLIIFLIGKLVNRASTIRKATKAIKAVQKEIAELKVHSAKGAQNIDKTMKQMAIVEGLLSQLNQYTDFSYFKIPKEDKPLLTQLVNDTLALTGILGEDI